jgi:hypothetical protein
MLFSSLGMGEGGGHNVVLKHGNNVGCMRRTGLYCSQMWEWGGASNCEEQREPIGNIWEQVENRLRIF